MPQQKADSRCCQVPEESFLLCYTGLAELFGLVGIGLNAANSFAQVLLGARACGAMLRPANLCCEA